MGSGGPGCKLLLPGVSLPPEAEPGPPANERRRVAAAVTRDLPRVMRLIIVAVVFGVLVNASFTLLTTDRHTLRALRQIGWEYLLLAAVLALVPLLAESLRLLIWARFFGRPLRLTDTIRCVCAGQVGSALAPIALGNAAAKTGMLVERGLTTGEAAAVEGLSVLEDSAFFVLAMPLVAYLTGAWHMEVVRHARAAVAHKLTPPWFVAGFMAFLISAGTAAALLARRRGRLFGFRDAFGDVWKRGKSRLIITVLLMGVHWVCRYSVITAVALALGLHENPLRLFFLQWFVFGVMAFVPLPGAALGAESAFYFVYNGTLPDWSIGVMTAGWRFFTFYFLVIVAAVALVVMPHEQRRSGPSKAIRG